MVVRVVLQSRLSSSRLPGKALLTLAGRPLVVLAAQRASNTGMDVIVATSVEPEDDVLAAAVEAAGVRVFRGPLHDTLHRFALATADLADDDLVVRLTGDNVGPDGAYVQLLIDEMERAGEHYIRVTTETIEGLGLEVCTARMLRAADARATAAYDREHVTPWIRRHTADLTWVPPVDGSAARVRCTVDTLLDFSIAAKAIATLSDPVHANWRDVLDAWVAAGGAQPTPLPGTRANPLGLGPWLLGGRSLGELTDAADASRTLERAAAQGVSHVETSLSYPGSAPRIGQALAHGLSERIGVLVTLPAGLPFGADAAAWETLAKLRHARVDALITECWSDFVAAGDELVALNADSVARSLGSVVHTREELAEALSDHRVSYVEVPAALGPEVPESSGEVVVVARCADLGQARAVRTFGGVGSALLDAASPAEVDAQAAVFSEV
jgi:spore coat polysaccharide biosynthesis protein SpsF